MRDFITTIDSDDESVQGESSRMARAATPAQNDMNPEFNFDADGGRTQGLDLWAEDEVKGGPQVSLSRVCAVTNVRASRSTISLSVAPVFGLRH